MADIPITTSSESLPSSSPDVRMAATRVETPSTDGMAVAIPPGRVRDRNQGSQPSGSGLQPAPSGTSLRPFANQGVQFSPTALERGDYANSPQVQASWNAQTDSATIHEETFNALTVDARQIHLQMGVPPEVHHQVVSATMQQAEAQHASIVQDLMNQASVSHEQFIQNQEVRSQARLAESTRSAESLHNQVVGGMEQRHQESMGNAQAFHNQVVKNMEDRLLQIQAQQAQQFEAEKQSMLTQFKGQLGNLEIQMTQVVQERDLLREQLRMMSSSQAPTPGRRSAAHCAPPAPAEGSYQPQFLVPPIPSSFQDHSVLESLQNSLNALNAKVLDLEAQSPLQKSSKNHKRKKSGSDNSASGSSSSSSEEDEEYLLEKRRMRLKSYEKLKVSSLPKSASDFRPWRNGLTASIAQCSRTSETFVYSWLRLGFEGTIEEVEPNEEFPILSRVLGTKLLELSKGSKFQLEFQSLQEKARIKGKHPSGLLLLHRIARRFHLEKERGMTLNSQHLLALKPSGNEIKDLEQFRDKVMYVLSGLDEGDQLNEGMMRSWLYEALKKVPCMQLKIERFRDASAGDPIRSFEWLCGKLEETLDEAQHDINSSSIMASLIGKTANLATLTKEDKGQGKNKEKKDKDKEKKEKQKEKKEKEKSAKAEQEATLAAAKAKPKPKPKAKENPKVIVPGEAGQPCLFFPSGTCRRDPCPFIHDAGGASSSADPKAKPKPKAKAKSVPHATAAVAALGSLPGVGALKTIFKGAVSMLPLLGQDTVFPAVECYHDHQAPLTSFDANSSTVEWILDSGAGRTVGTLDQIPDEYHGVSQNPVSFATGGGKKQGGTSCRVHGDISGDSECYLLESSPWALSLGEQARKGKAFIWLPAQSPDDPLPLPFLVDKQNVEHLKVSCPEEYRIYADKVKENVPIFKEHVEVSHMPAVEEAENGGDSDYTPSLPPEDSGAGRGMVGEEERKEPEDEDVFPVLEHSLLHLPKDPYCIVCQQAKQDSAPARKFGAPHPLTDGEIATAFGDRIHADHVIVAKSKAERSKFGVKGERVALILWDDYTKLIAAYPAQSKSTEETTKALRHFLGKRIAVELHCDNAPELENAANQLGLVHTPTVPYRKTAVINRKIRTLEDSCRCSIVQAGRMQQLWPLAIQYVSNAMCFQQWKSLHDEEWFGEKIPFACLVHFRPNERESKLGPKTSPGLFMGWRFEPGFGFKGVYRVAPLENLNAFIGGKAPFKVTTTTKVVPVKPWVFPLKEAREKAWESIADEVQVEDVGPLEELPDIEGPVMKIDLPSIPKDEKKRSITLERFMKFGPTSGCKACEEGGDRHNSYCRERFDTLIKESMHSFPSDMPKGFDQWRLEEDGTLVRYHFVRRKKLFNPLKCDKDPPAKLSSFAKRITFATKEDGTKLDPVEHDDWTDTGEWKVFWTGKTVFFPKEVPAATAKAEPSSDSWEVDYRKGILVRHHFSSRSDLFNPTSIPIPVEWLTGSRITIAISDSTNREKTVKDSLSSPNSKPFSGTWTGKTYFMFKGAGSVVPHARYREKQQKSLPGYGTLIEFCCEENSTMGKISQATGLKHIRLTKGVGNMQDPCQVSQLLEGLESGFLDGCDLWGSLPCTAWSRWQTVNLSRLGPHFRAKLLAKREESKVLQRTFFQAAEIVVRRGGRVHFEWPASCSGWELPELQKFLSHPLFTLVKCNACAFGSEHFKPWQIATMSPSLAAALEEKKCPHGSKHSHVQVAGKYTEPSGFYPMAFSECIVAQLFPDKVYNNRRDCHGGWVFNS